MSERVTPSPPLPPRQHRGQLADHCGPCRSEQIADKGAS